MQFIIVSREHGSRGRAGMDYRKLGSSYYIRMDKGDEIIASIRDVCRREGVSSATFTGIGGCQDAEIQVFRPERGEFETERVEGLLELVTLTGNLILRDDGELSHHVHALFAYQGADGQRIAAGHLKSSTVLYTAEIELRPVEGGAIGASLDPETGTCFWTFK